MLKIEDNDQKIINELKIAGLYTQLPKMDNELKIVMVPAGSVLYLRFSGQADPKDNGWVRVEIIDPLTPEEEMQVAEIRAALASRVHSCPTFIRPQQG
jgi:hypothetical protein